MKHSINRIIIALLMIGGLHTDIVLGIPVRTVPVTEGEESIVDAIKANSDLMESDVNQYKLLWLGSVGTGGAFLAGIASSMGAGIKTYQNVGLIQEKTAEYLPNWMTTLMLTGLGTAGTGYLSYRLLYPRIRAGVMSKVQKFINVCEGLNADSPKDRTGQIYSIVNYSFNNLQQLKDYLPQSWPEGDDVAVYNALYNLAQQARRAQLLLNQIGSDREITAKSKIVKEYAKNLNNNASMYASIINEVDRKKRAAAELAGIEAGTSLMKAKTLEAYAAMFTNAVKDTYNGLKYMYENKEAIIAKATVASVAAVGMYAYIKSKLNINK